MVAPWCARPLVAAAVLVALGAPAAAQSGSRRDLVSPAHAAAVEAIAARRHPGATLDWEREVLVLPDGRAARWGMRVIRLQPQGADWLAVAAPEFTAEVEDAVQRFEKAGTLPDPPRTCTMVAVRLGPGGGPVLGYREAAVDVASSLSACERVNFEYAHDLSRTPPPARPADWPEVHVGFTTFHRGPDWRGAITWAAVLDTVTMTWLARVPVAVKRRDAAGAVALDFLRRAPDGPGTARFAGQLTGFALEFACWPGDCRAEPDAVLDAFARGASTPGPASPGRRP